MSLFAKPLLADTPPDDAPLRHSFWKHRKSGHVYEVENVGRFEPTPFVFGVVYRCVALTYGSVVTEAVSWIRTLAEWNEVVDVEGVVGPRFVPLTEPERLALQCARASLNRSGPWGIVSFTPLAKVGFSSELLVTRVIVADEHDAGQSWRVPGAWPAREVPAGSIVMTIGNRLTIVPPERFVSGGPWLYRADARRAKAAYVKERKLCKTTAAEVWGWEPDSPSY